MTAKENLINRLKARLAKVRAAIDAEIANGSTYSLSGSHSKTSVSLDALKAEESALVMRLARLGGDRRRNGIVFPEFQKVRCFNAR